VCLKAPFQKTPHLDGETPDFLQIAITQPDFG